MTVVLSKKSATKSVPISKAVRRTNPDPGKQRRRALERREKLIQQLGEWSNQSVLLSECVWLLLAVSRGKGDKMED